MFRIRRVGMGGTVRVRPLAEAHLNFADKSVLRFQGPLIIEFDEDQLDNRFNGQAVSFLRKQVILSELARACGKHSTFKIVRPGYPVASRG